MIYLRPGAIVVAERIEEYRAVVLEALGRAGWEIDSDEELDDALRVLVPTSSDSLPGGDS